MKVNTDETKKEKQTSIKNKEKKPKKTRQGKNQMPQAADEKQTPEQKEPKSGIIELIKTGELFRKNKFWIVLSVILFFVFISVNSNMNNTKMGLMVKLRDLTSGVANYEAAIEDVKEQQEEQAKIDAATLTDAEAESASHNAVEQGVRVATLQNTYKTVTADNKEAFDDNVNKLDACFDPNDSNARVPWYNYHTFVPGTWEFVSKADFKLTSAKVLWLCRADEDKTLLAYCTASYNATTTLFSNVEWKLTGYAQSKIGTDDPEETGTGNITPIIDSLKAVTPENPTEMDENTNNEVSQTKSDYKNDVKNGKIEGEDYDTRYDPGLNKPADETERSDTDETGKNET